MRNGKILVAGFVVGLLGTLVNSAPAWAEDTGKKAEEAAKSAGKDVSDAWITSKTKIALYADDRVSGTRVNVDTKRGVVTLRGKVDSDAAKASAESTAKAIDGVKEVKNLLQVVAPGKREVVDAKDDMLKDHVEKAVKKDPLMKKASVDVRSDAGVITLSGSAPSWTVCARASELARDVAGVKAVKNNIEVKE